MWDTSGSKFMPEFPDSVDVKITSKCEIGCCMCRENSYHWGEHGDIMNAEFINTLKRWLGGLSCGDSLSHPRLLQFLRLLKSKDILTSITANQIHFQQESGLIRQPIKDQLICRLDVSFVRTDEWLFDTLTSSLYENATIHVINGVINSDALLEMAERGVKKSILWGSKIRGEQSVITTTCMNRSDATQKH
jgi:hypothetical protein